MGMYTSDVHRKIGFLTHLSVIQPFQTKKMLFLLFDVTHPRVLKKIF